MRPYSLQIIAAMAGVAVASPVVEVAERGNANNIINRIECLIVDFVVDVLHECPTATPYCSSFLHIPTITHTATATVTSPSTIHITSTTGTVTVTPVVTATATATNTVTTCTANQQPPGKRNFPVQRPKPTKLSRYADAQISTACRCLGIPTPTTTVTTTATRKPTVTKVTKIIATATAAASTSTTTTTVTQTVNYCPAPTLCGNQGVQFAYYPNDDGPNNDDLYSTFHPEEYKDDVPTFSGTTDSVGGIDIPGDSEFSIYGSQPVSTNYFVLNHRGYVYAQQPGTYTFEASQVDDSVYIWVGPVAYSGWNGPNANLFVTIGQGGTGSYSIDLTEGQYYALRIVFAQAQGPASFSLQVTAPDGSVFLSDSSTASPYLVQYSCDGTTAPKYPAFGQET